MTLVENLELLAPQLSTLLTCLSEKPGDQLRARLEKIPAWEPIIEAAKRHGVTPLLSSNLQAHCKVLPETALRELEAGFRTNALRNLMRTRELLRMLRIFEEACINAIPYKGPVLASVAYGNLALREFFDLDILVSPADVLRAKDLLIANGYHSDTQLTPQQLHSYLRSGCEFGFHLEGEDCNLELHWRVAPWMFSVPFNFEELWARRKSIVLGEAKVASLSSADMLLVLCVHAMKHSWNCLCWVVDVAELVKSDPPLDWKATFTRARKLGIERILLLGLWLAQELLAAQLPEAVRLRLRDRKVIALGEEAVDNLRSSARPTFSLADHLFLIRSRENWRDRFAYVVRVLLTPDIADWQSTRLPAIAFPLYCVVRLWRLMKKFMPAFLTPAQKLARSAK